MDVFVGPHPWLRSWKLIRITRGLQRKTVLDHSERAPIPRSFGVSGSFLRSPEGVENSEFQKTPEFMGGWSWKTIRRILLGWVLVIFSGANSRVKLQGGAVKLG